MHFFGIPIIRSMASGCLLVETQKVASKFLHTRFTHNEILKNFKLEFLLESLAIRAPPAPLPHFHCLVSFAEKSKGTLSPCIHLERIAASGRIIPTKEESIGSLMNLAAK